MSDRSAEMLDAIRAAEIEDDDDADYAKPRKPMGPAQVYSVRIPVDRIEQLRRVADEKGTAPSTLIRQWVIERLDADGEQQPSTYWIQRPVHVADFRWLRSSFTEHEYA